MEDQVFKAGDIGLFYKDFSKHTYITQMGWILVDKNAMTRDLQVSIC